MRVFFFLFVLTVLELHDEVSVQFGLEFDAELDVELFEVVDVLLFTTVVPFGRLVVRLCTLFGLLVSTFKLFELRI